MTVHGSDARVIRLQSRMTADPARLAQRRLASARRASGMTPAAWASALDAATKYHVTEAAVTAWETTACAPTDLTIAAELIAGTAPDEAEPVRLISDYTDLQATMNAIVAGAQEQFAVTGSRSRDPGYLGLIEQALAERPALIHHRVLYGPIRHGATKNHLRRLIDLQRPAGTLFIAIARDTLRDSERFICASENEAVVVLPSITGILNFDTAIHFTDPDTARMWVTRVHEAWSGADALTTREHIDNLEIV
jgi:DNA-binding transcriptional regulator YiaG